MFRILEDVLARLGISVVVAILVVLLTAAGIGLLVAALWLWLDTIVATHTAALLCGVAVFVLAGLALVTGRLLARRRTPLSSGRALPVGAVGGPTKGIAAAIGSELGTAGSTWVKGNAPRVVLVAVAAGFLLGASPRLRDTVWRLLR